MAGKIGIVNSQVLVGVCAIVLAVVIPWLGWAADDIPTKFSNSGGITKTRHNLTQAADGISSVQMDRYRNNYGEVCVYCHTPHGANNSIQAPLWNRTLTTATYQTYDQLETASLTGEVVAPGPNSLTCLSCHDGTVAVDSIINMPGSGRYSAAQVTSQQASFLGTWRNASGVDATVHIGLSGAGCLVCHSSGAGVVGAGAADFTVAAIGVNLKDDHPVGVEFVAADLKAYDKSNGRIAYWDTNGNSRPDASDLRLYNSGAGYRVECASCHDPHGVPTDLSRTTLIRSFLRRDNGESRLCQTCHAK